jgi:hypothetical protein
MRKPVMPEGLYISVSQLKCYLRCPRQYELKYVKGCPRPSCRPPSRLAPRSTRRWPSCTRR